MPVWVVVSVVSSASGLAGLWLILRFLWRIYDRGGIDDLRDAARAVQVVRPSWRHLGSEVRRRRR